MKRPPAPARNEAGPRHPPPPCPPIDPRLVYPIRRLADWGFGARTVAAMRKGGLPVLAYSKWRFVRGVDLIDFLAGASGEQEGAN